jgi:NAD(P)-dependent dehydrogenase (short-subunit alcohol dehydrogenase family)
VLVIGAGSGIGRAAALAFAAEGAWVAVADVDEAAAAETAELVARSGGEARAYRTDVTSTRELDATVASVVEERGRLDALSQNAGVPMAIRLEELTSEQWARAIDVNLTGTAMACKAVLAPMLRQGGGSIVLTASVMGLVAGLPNQPAYVAAKGGVVLLTKALATDYARENVRVNAVCPTLTETPMIDEFLRTQFPGEAEREAAKRELHGVQPTGRMCRPEEIANAIVFLASPLASGITGVALPVDGGFAAR